MRFADAVEEYMLEKAIATSERTQGWYRERLDYFVRDTGIEQLEQFTPGLITRYLHANRHLAWATIDNYRRALSVFANWCFRRKLLDENPFDVLPKLKRTRDQRPTTFTVAHIHAILNVARSSQHKQRDVALVLTLLDTGIRIGEAANLELQDIDWEAMLFHVNGKTGERDVPFSGKTKHALRAYVLRKRRAVASERHVFVTYDGGALKAEQLGKHVSRLAKRAGVQGPKLGPTPSGTRSPTST